MKINPTLDKIVVKKIEFEKVYKGSIILTSKNQDNINKLIYEVVECGPGGIIDKDDIKIVVKPGDKVIIPEYIGSEINIDNVQYRIVKQSDILAILEY